MPRPSVIPTFSVEDVVAAGYWDRVFARADPQHNGCIIWRGSTNSTGYPKIDVRLGSVRYQFSVHRLVWAMVHGEWPPVDLRILHATPKGCIGKGCVAPKHLRLGTDGENMADRVLEGKFIRGYGRVTAEHREEIIRLKKAKVRTEDIAQQLGFSMSTISKHWQRAREAGWV